MNTFLKRLRHPNTFLFSIGTFSFPPMPEDRSDWCAGALVRWCAGALVRWCAGALVRWCKVSHDCNL